MKNLFVVFDGMDGSGKSELVKLVSNYLKEKGFQVLTTMEPSDSEEGKKIREILKKELDPSTNGEKLLELFTLDRKKHLEKEIKPFLERKNEKARIVLCDRYYYSTIAFQVTQGIEVEKTIEKNKNFLKPDIAFILDIKPEIALQRIKHRKKEKFEEIDFMKKLRENFLKIPDYLEDNIKIIDATRNIEEVFQSIIEE